MTYLRPLSAAALLCTALATPLQADVTADQVWVLLQDALTEPDFALTGTDTRQGDRLVLTALRLTFKTGEVVELPQITLQEMPDKSVVISLPPSFPLVVDLPPNSIDPGKNSTSIAAISVSIAAPDLAITVRGLGDQTDFDLKAGSISASLDPIDFPALDDLSKADMFFALALADLAVSWKLTVNDTEFAVQGAFSLGTLHGDIRMDIPNEQIKGEMSFDISAIDARLNGFAPANTEATIKGIDQSKDSMVADLLALLDRGMMLESGLTIGAASVRADVPDNPDGPVKLDLSSQDGVGTVTLDRTGMAVMGKVGKSKVYLKALEPGVPFTEVEFGMEEFSEGASFGFPQPGVVHSPAWGFFYRLKGITVSDNIWDLADPGKLLARGPVSVVIDLGGTYTLDPAFLKPGWVTPDPLSPAPFTAVTVELNEVMTEGLGVSTVGTGSMAFDLENPVMIEDFILPEGKVGFVTTGANGLIDALSAMGRLSEDERTAARFALLFMGRIEGGADRLVTNLEFRDGGLFLNGQKIR